MTAKKKPARLLVHVDVLAGALAMSRRQVYALITEGVLPKPTTRGKHDLPLAASSYVEHLRAEQGDPDLIALRKVKAERAALELHVRREQVARAEIGPLVPLANANAFVAAAFTAYRESMSAFAARAAPTLAGLRDPGDVREVFATLQALHDQAINEAVNYAYLKAVGHPPSENGHGRIA